MSRHVEGVVAAGFDPRLTSPVATHCHEYLEVFRQSNRSARGLLEYAGSWGGRPSDLFARGSREGEASRGGLAAPPMRAASSCSLERSGRIGAVSMGRRRNRGLPACCLWILVLLITRSSGSCGSEELAVLSKMLASENACVIVPYARYGDSAAGRQPAVSGACVVCALLSYM